MNKVELIAAMAEKTGMSKKDTEKTLAAFTETVKETLQNGEKVSIVGFGIFEAKKRASREGINPRTGEKIMIPETTAPTFKAGKSLKEALGK
ncbi:MAG: HU family DNA-binding protein [Eubacteriaceae bacterium]|nr:HU family DNA-binding protein [Eubacteriaceae bacterium]